MGTLTLIIPHLGVRTLRFLLETITTKGRLVLRIFRTDNIGLILGCDDVISHTMQFGVKLFSQS